MHRTSVNAEITGNGRHSWQIHIDRQRCQRTERTEHNIKQQTHLRCLLGIHG
ncbi:Uncharacterised protein [Vibrio cholerae]|uniref:Uncharacterized protein n=1 Tax=Vibrio cholerae TaxID=666 RepID=A0A655PZW5_VIBCL|nr:Uncharacterised protein [Vibrio cholerae]CSC64403.1 Uncharacterised protein [Vibrio cholerae]